jgi:hypothetical protein
MGRWGAGLGTGSYAPVLVLKLDEYREYFLAKYKALDPIFEDYNNLIVYMHIWLPGSQINWHHDGPTTENNFERLSSTIYLTENWNWNWGGLFVYDDFPPYLALFLTYLFPFIIVHISYSPLF